MFIGSDLVVTMNTFILSYAFFVLLVVQVFVADSKPAVIILSDSSPAQELEPSGERRFLAEYRESEFVKRIQYWGDIDGALVSEDDLEDADKTVVYYYSSFDPKDVSQQALILATLPNLNLTNVQLSEVEDEATKLEYSEILLGSQSELERRLDGEHEDRRTLVLSFDVDGSVVRNGSLNAAYTATFFMTDQLEDAFPVSVIGPMELPRLSTLIESSVASPIPSLPTAICFSDGVPVSRMLINKDTTEVLDNCEEFVVFELFWSNAFDKDLALVGRDIAGYRVPYNTLLITSILPTAFFYLAVLLLAIATLCFSKVVKGTNRFKRFFLRAPLAISGFLLGAVLTLTGLI
jgi:hypothetical protein